MKLLTIVVPVYNTEKYIKRCLDSILLKPVLDDIEVIVVNDGSKDNSINIINTYEKKFKNVIKVIDKENGGHGSTINIGIKNATGKYFKVLDSDDWFDSNAFIKFVKKLKKSDEDLIINPYYQEYVYNGYQILFDYPNFQVGETYDFSNIKLEDLNDFYFVMASSTYKLEILKESNLNLYEKTFYVDMQYNVIPIKKVKSIRFEGENIYRYFIGRPDQSMNIDSMIRNMKDHEKVLYYLIDYYINNKDEIGELKSRYIKKIIVLMSYTHINIIGIQWKKRFESYKLIKSFEKHLRLSNSDIYDEIMKYWYMKYGKKMGYLNVLICNKLFIKFMSFASKVKRRIKK